MRSKTLVVLMTAAALALPSLASAGDGRYRYAKVVDVQPLYRYETVQIPQRECWTRTEYRETTYRRSRSNGGSALPTIAGGVIGGVIGRQFGSGDGRDAMTVVGTLVGAAIGHSSAQRRFDDRRYDDGRYVDYHRAPVERCETWYETEERRTVEAYRVTYRYAGRLYHTRTAQPPGKRIRVHVDITPA
jgi:uncharacterized protein YcfJ